MKRPFPRRGSLPLLICALLLGACMRSPKITVRAGTRTEEDGELTPREEAREGTFSFLGCDLEYRGLKEMTRFDVRFFYRETEDAPAREMHGAWFNRDNEGTIRYTGDWYPRQSGIFECRWTSPVGNAVARIKVLPRI